MAEKLIFISTKTNPFYEKVVNYDFVPGNSPSQRKKNVANLNNALSKLFPGLKALEISTKSENKIGRLLSAFHLKLDDKYIESIFQSSKVFEDGSQYSFLIDKKPIEAKRFINSLAKKEIVGFRFKGIDYPINPKSLFYDYLFVTALRNNPELSLNLKNYDIFTDIEFNYKKSVNCQARACAIYSYLLKTGNVDKYVDDICLFKKLYDGIHSDSISLFDIK